MSDPAATPGPPGTYPGLVDRERDEQILDRVRQGDRESFGMLVRHYERPLYNFMVRHRLDVETSADLTQEAFLKAYRSLESFQPQRSSFKTWLYTIAFNLIRDNARRHRVRSRGADELQSQEEVRPPARSVETDVAVRDQLERLLGVLEDEDRSLLVLRFLQEVPYNEISEVTGMPAATIRSKVHRALKKIQEHLPASLREAWS